MLETNKRYSVAELAAAVGEGRPKTTKATKNFLNHLATFVEYHTEQPNKRVYYVIDKIKCEYVKKSEFNKKAISDYVDEKIQFDNKGIYIPKSLSRQGMHDEQLLSIYQPSTIGEYIRLDLNEGYGKEVLQGGKRGIITERVWVEVVNEGSAEEYCRPLEEEEIEFLCQCYSDAKKTKEKKELELLADLHEEYKTKEEFDKESRNILISYFNEAKDKFYNKYQFYPRRANKYTKGAYATTN